MDSQDDSESPLNQVPAAYDAAVRGVHGTVRDHIEAMIHEILSAMTDEDFAVLSEQVQLGRLQHVPRKLNQLCVLYHLSASQQSRALEMLNALRNPPTTRRPDEDGHIQ